MPTVYSNAQIKATKLKLRRNVLFFTRMASASVARGKFHRVDGF